MAQCNKPQTVYWNYLTKKHQYNYGKNCNIKPILIPCGKCLSCQTNWINEIGIRCQHELAYHNGIGTFLTFTVSDEYMEEVFPNNHLRHDKFKQFIKSLRGWIKDNVEGNPKIKYMMCGEYGENFGRAHYHAVIFGWEPPDKVRRINSSDTKPLYNSAMLERLWKYGFITVGDVSIASCKYLGKYVAKAKGFPEERYINQLTGEIIPKEYLSSSKGFGWRTIEQNIDQVFTKGYFNGVKQRGQKEAPKYKIPRFYWKKLEEKYPDKFLKYKNKKIELAIQETEKFLEKNLGMAPDPKVINYYMREEKITREQALKRIAEENKKTVKYAYEEEILGVHYKVGSVRQKIQNAKAKHFSTYQRPADFNN